MPGNIDIRGGGGGRDDEVDAFSLQPPGARRLNCDKCCLIDSVNRLKRQLAPAFLSGKQGSWFQLFGGMAGVWPLLRSAAVYRKILGRDGGGWVDVQVSRMV